MLELCHVMKAIECSFDLTVPLAGGRPLVGDRRQNFSTWELGRSHGA